jgi:cation transport ATPase
MKTLALLFSLISIANPALAREGVPDRFKAGRYAMKISGFFCTTCGVAMKREVGALPEVSEADFDFDTETLFVTVRLERTLRLSALRRALRRAAARVDIGSKLDVADVTYRPN